MFKGSDQDYKRADQQFRELVRTTARCYVCHGRVGVMEAFVWPEGGLAQWGCLKCRQLGFTAAGTPEFRAEAERLFSEAGYLKDDHDFH